MNSRSRTVGLCARAIRLGVRQDLTLFLASNVVRRFGLKEKAVDGSRPVNGGFTRLREGVKVRRCESDRARRASGQRADAVTKIIFELAAKAVTGRAAAFLGVMPSAALLGPPPSVADAPASVKFHIRTWSVHRPSGGGAQRARRRPSDRGAR